MPSRTTALRRRVIAAVLGIAVLAILAAVVIVGGNGSEDGSEEADAASAAQIPERVAGLVDEMEPSELVDQVLLLGFDGTEPGAAFVDDLERAQLGGVVVRPDNWTDAGTGTALVQALRAAGRKDDHIPPLVVVSQEGGEYRALADLPPEQTELEIGDAASRDGAEEWSETTATALADAGFDLNLSPVADVATLDSPIADRAFSDDPAVAAEMTAAAVRGCRRAEVACAAAHFPGLGAVSQDPARGPATVSLDPAGLEARDLQAFRAAFEERVPAVVMSLAFYAAYDPVTPGALAEPVATGLLRDELGFEGVAITDDLGAGAVRSSRRVPDAAIQALRAGSDLVQIGSPDHQDGVQAAILGAVEAGELPEERLREAAGRVLELKRELGLL